MTTLVAGLAQAELGRRLEKGVAELGLALGRDGRNKLLQYLALLEKWNQVYNLTAIRGGEKMVSGHLLDCLAVIPYMTGTRVLDAGSGAGFPGIPIAVARPDIQVALLDSNHKKAAFLRQAVAELQLKNAIVVCERVEAWHAAEKFDCIISRAFAEIAEFIALTGHLLAPGGVLAAMKGVYPFEEIERLQPGFRLRQVHAFAVPGLDAERHLVLIERA
ncbi:MAG TPA: 16S rRNA (guanine(527)-N(7))-methyltransferase RsmG [Burkholderiales bacterium]|jgi:16S rRNA (guanine527-N7)-methyltransferase|nr:16S rRNA (guanine(527)-N(7))-methyltransferase RsmG [Burkholderiales bacterium]